MGDDAHPIAGRVLAALTDDEEVIRIIKRRERVWADEIVTRRERRQWSKPAKKPKALRGRP